LQKKGFNLQDGAYYASQWGKVRIKRVNSMSFMDNDAVLTTKEAAKYLRISKVTLLKYIRFGRIKAIKAGRGWKIHRSELGRFLNGDE
jgi:excisionase family DNA binding protein